MVYTTDNATGMWLGRFLEQRLPIVLEKRYPELVFANGRFLPDVMDLNAGADSVVVEMVNEYGEAAIEGDTDSIPMAEISVSEDKGKVVAVMAGYAYSMREADAAEEASRNGQMATNLSDRRMIRARRMIDEKCHRIGAYGDTRRGVKGVLSDTNVPVVNSTFNPYTSTTQQDGIDWFGSFITDIRVDSELIESPNLALVPEELYRKWATTFRSTNSDSTMLESILKANPSVMAIAPYQEGRSANLERYGVMPAGTNKDRMLVYNLSPENLFRRCSAIRPVPVQLRGMRYEGFFYKAISDVMWEYPLTARYVDYPKAA